MYKPQGYIKLHRRLLSWRWYGDPVVRSVFIHLLLTASFTAQEWESVNLSAGDTVTSVKSLSETLGFSLQQIRTALKKLERTGEITLRPTNRFTVITLNNWEKYQTVRDSSTDESADGQQTDNIQPKNRQQRYNNYNKNNKYKTAKNTPTTVSYDIEEFEKKAQELPVYRSSRKRQ